MTTLYLIDDDSDIRSYITTIVESINIQVLSYESADKFLSAYNPSFNGCILCDIVMPHMDGLEFQVEVIKRDIALPLMFMSAHGSITTVKTVLKNGATDFLEKPLDINELLTAIKYGLSISKAKRINSDTHIKTVEKLKILTHRENEILQYLVVGKENREVAQLLNISIRTVETHRNHLLKKMGYSSLKQLLTHTSVINDLH